MADANATQAITVDENNKNFSLSDKWCVSESRPFTITLESGNYFPSGAYSLALSWNGRTMALAGCTLATGVLSGTLNLNTSELIAVFNVLAPKRIQCDLTVWDNTGRVTWARGRCDVWFTDYTTSGSTPTPVVDDYYSGTESLSANDASKEVDISAYELSAAPAQIFVTVESAADNIFGTVTASSATAFTVTFSAPIPAANYKLHWLIFTA